MNLTDLIAIFSLIFSVSAFVYSIMAEKKVKENNKKLQQYEIKSYKEKEDEKKKALIEAKIYRSEKWTLINVYNRGLGTARNIIFLNTDDWDKNGIFVESGKSPYPFLHNGGCFDMKLIIAERLHKTQMILINFWRTI